MANPPAGWHPDPLNRHAQRYWDGNQWSEHVADQSGNMTTDPLDGGQSAQQDTGQQDTSWGADQSSAAAGGDAGTSAGDTPSWGTDQSTSEETPSWGGDDTSADDAPSWGGTTDTTDTVGDATTDETTPAWGESATADPQADHTAMVNESMGDAGVADAGAGGVDASDTAATDEPAWGSGAGAAGAAAAAGGVAAADAGTSDADTADTDTGTSDTGAPTGLADPGSASADHRSIARIEVGDGMVVRHGHVVASSGDVALGDSPHPGSMSASGSGTVWVGATGRDITVMDVPAAGLTVRDDALVAHGSGLVRAAASDGIVGFDGTSVTGDGWVALAASGGTLEVSPAGGIDVSVGSLVAWTSDLDVSHAEHVNLSGHGTVVISAGD